MKFNKNQEYYQKNREKIIASSKQWRENHPDLSSYYRARHRKKTYGLTTAQFDALMLTQCGKCAICTITLDSENRITMPCIDHNHLTGQVRGLLCFQCNLAIGFLADDPALLVAANDYLGEY